MLEGLSRHNRRSGRHSVWSDALRVKYCLLAGGAAVWLFGLVSQLHSIETTATYVVISAGMAALAWL